MAPYEESALLKNNHQTYQTSKRPSDFVRSPLSQRTKAILTVMGFLCTVSWLSRTIIEISKDLGYDITILHPAIAHLPKAFIIIGLFAPLIDHKDIDSMTANLGRPSNPLFVTLSIYCVPTIMVALVVGDMLAPEVTEQVERVVAVFGPPALLLSHGGFRRWLSSKLDSSKKGEMLRDMAALEDDDFNCMTGM
ncbi:MAG: hypothetical protein LQ337_006630 [Flavoplaca oasis]|nr:MAG: hypothetical protein LQ337_006630 [Flavoplaca oasis]